MEGKRLRTNSILSFLSSALAFLYSSIASSRSAIFLEKQLPRGPETQIF
jgi:hypothetical protein